MTPERLARLLAEVAAGTLSPGEALERLRHFPTETLPFAQLDHHRALRQGYPEVIFGAGKTVPQLLTICHRLAAAGAGFLATRIGSEQGEAVLAQFPVVEWNRLGRTLLLRGEHPPRSPGRVLVLCAGTSDLPAAEEAGVTLDAMGIVADRLVDVGVAGLHRLLGAMEQLRVADVLIVAAGMDGALPSVVGGLVRQPVIALPTSVGYGGSFEGLAALLAMLNSCAAGVTVVNIDNGFGAAMAAARMLSLRAEDGH